MELFEILVEVVGVSASGVLAPGPMFFANLLYGSRLGPKAGVNMAFGHTIVELPLIALLATGIISSSSESVRANLDIIGLVGGLAILGFAGLQLLAIRRAGVYKPLLPSITAGRQSSPFLAGILLSALNPFFLLWWLTVGLKVVSDSLSLGLVGAVAVVFGFHIWMDYAWLTGTAYLSSRGESMLKSRYYRILILSMVGVLVYFGLEFVLSSLL
jgi:threonine/homoserine/homoserine lactone efflux protein